MLCENENAVEECSERHLEAEEGAICSGLILVGFFFLKKLDFMHLSLQCRYLTHQLLLKSNNFQGSEL